MTALSSLRLLASIVWYLMVNATATSQGYQANNNPLSVSALRPSFLMRYHLPRTTEDQPPLYRPAHSGSGNNHGDSRDTGKSSNAAPAMPAWTRWPIPRMATMKTKRSWAAMKASPVLFHQEDDRSTMSEASSLKRSSKASGAFLISRRPRSLDQWEVDSSSVPSGGLPVSSDDGRKGLEQQDLTMPEPYNTEEVDKVGTDDVLTLKMPPVYRDRDNVALPILRLPSAAKRSGRLSINGALTSLADMLLAENLRQEGSSIHRLLEYAG